MMSFLWLDVTTIIGWQRPAVGIARVESECAIYALGQNTDTRTHFCRFDGSSKRYIEVSPEEVRVALNRICHQRVPTPSPDPSADTPQGTQPPQWLESRLVAYLLRLIEMLPSSLRGRAFNFASRRKPAYDAAVRSCREMRSAVRGFLRPSGDNVSISPMPVERTDPAIVHPVPFSHDDVYVSLGLDWDQKDEFSYLFAQKRRVGFKVLLFCYDIIPVKFPHLCVGDVAARFARYFANLAWCADHILCISECSRKDLLNLLEELGTPIPRTEVVRLGSEIRTQGDEPVSAEVGEVLAQNYILYVSTIERRKNHETLYRAYSRLVDLGVKDLPLLVFVGMPGWGVNDLLSDIRFDPRTQPYIRILNHVYDSDLSNLYRNAYFTVYPSLYEGWGLPVAEALEYGKFCLASSAASIREVGGDLLEYIDPWNVQAWADRMMWYIENPDEIRRAEQVIRTQYTTTKWSSSARFIFQRALNLCS